MENQIKKIELPPSSLAGTNLNQVQALSNLPDDQDQEPDERGKQIFYQDGSNNSDDFQSQTNLEEHKDNVARSVAGLVISHGGHTGGTNEQPEAEEGLNRLSEKQIPINEEQSPANRQSRQKQLHSASLQQLVLQQPLNTQQPITTQLSSNNKRAMKSKEARQPSQEQSAGSQARNQPRQGLAQVPLPPSSRKKPVSRILMMQEPEQESYEGDPNALPDDQEVLRLKQIGSTISNQQRPRQLGGAGLVQAGLANGLEDDSLLQHTSNSAEEINRAQATEPNQDHQPEEAKVPPEMTGSALNKLSVKPSAVPDAKFIQTTEAKTSARVAEKVHYSKTEAVTPSVSKRQAEEDLMPAEDEMKELSPKLIPAYPPLSKMSISQGQVIRPILEERKSQVGSRQSRDLNLINQFMSHDTLTYSNSTKPYHKKFAEDHQSTQVQEVEEGKGELQLNERAFFSKNSSGVATPAMASHFSNRMLTEDFVLSEPMEPISEGEEPNISRIQHQRVDESDHSILKTMGPSAKPKKPVDGLSNEIGFIGIKPVIDIAQVDQQSQPSLLNSVNKRFQYHQRVFTHRSVNKYLVVKNVSTKELLNVAQIMTPAAAGTPLHSKTFLNNAAGSLLSTSQVHTIIHALPQIRSTNENQAQILPSSILQPQLPHLLKLSEGIKKGSLNEVDPEKMMSLAVEGKESESISKDRVGGPHAIQSIIYPESSRYDSQPQIQMGEESKSSHSFRQSQPKHLQSYAKLSAPAKESIEVIPVHLQTYEKIELRDFLPYSQDAKHEVLSDDSNDYIDDFSLGQTHIYHDDPYKKLNETLPNLAIRYHSSSEEEDHVANERLQPDEFIANKIRILKKRARVIKFNESEFPGISKMSQSEVSKLVFTELKKAAPYSVYQLPDRHIAIPQLNLNHPLTIKGTSSTILEILNGNIIVDFRDFIDSTFKGLTIKDHQDFRCILAEVNIVYKFSPSVILQSMVAHEKRLSSYGTLNSPLYTDRCFSYYKLDEKGVLTLPFIVVEKFSSLDVNDCYFRSIQLPPSSNQAAPLSSPDGNNDTVLHTPQKEANADKLPLFFKEAQEIGFWINGDLTSAADLKDAVADNETHVRLCSSIFYNFFQSVRAGINSKVFIEKCHFSESRHDTISLTNPRSVLFRSCQISRCGESGLRIGWLETSSWADHIRTILIEGCNFEYCKGNAVFIGAVQCDFAAHNLKIEISNCNAKRCIETTIKIRNLALNDLQIQDINITKNEQTAIHLRQVHQKSNKFKFKADKIQVKDTLKGHGLLLEDTGILLHESKFESNDKDGIHIDSQEWPKPVRILQKEVEEFLKRQPIKIVLQSVSIIQNKINGVSILGFWKGCIEIREAFIIGNYEHGVFAASEQSPVLQNDDVKILSRYQDKNSVRIKGKISTRVAPTDLSTADRIYVRDQVLEDFEEIPGKKKGVLKSMQNEIVLGQILIEDSMICEQVSTGMCFSKVVVVIGLESMIIRKNTDYALYVPEEASKNFIYLYLESLKEYRGGTNFEQMSPQSKRRISTLLSEDPETDSKIQGKMGGPWGKFRVIEEEKTSTFFSGIMGSQNQCQCTCFGFGCTKKK